MTSISYLGVTSGTTTAGPFNVTVPGSANKRMAFFVYNAESSNSGLQLSDVRYDSAGANTALTLVGRSEYSNGGTLNDVIEVWRLPEASIQAGAKSFSWTVVGTASTARQSVVTFDGVDQTTPTNGYGSADIVATTTGSSTTDPNTDGGTLAITTVATSTVTHDWSANSFTEIVDAGMSTVAARSIAYRIASGTIVASVTLSASDSGKLVSIAINADGLAPAIDLTSVNAGSAMTEGQAAVALVGTSMNVAGAGARLRIVSAPGTYQAMSSYSASSAVAATATVPTLTSLPFSQNAAGTGLTTWNVEAMGTATGGNDGTPVSVELRPQSGWDVVEIATPDLSAASLLSHLGWTAIATDLISWDTTVVVDTITVTIGVNDDGTYTYTSVYTSGGTAAALPAFTWDYKAYDSANKLWTSAATVTVGAGGSSTTSRGGPLRSPIRSPIRSAVRGTIH